MGGVFGGGTAAIVWTRPVIATFERQRGLALGLATAGTSIAGMLAPPLLAGVMGEGGWRAGFFVLAALTGLVGMPLALMLIGRARERVADVVDDVSAALRAPDVALREAVRGLRFWLLILAIVCINIPGSGVLGQLAPIISDRGLNDGDVALVMSLYAAGLLVGRVLSGFALDRFPAPLVGAVTTLVPALGILMLMAPAQSFALAALAVAMIGMQQGAEVDLFAYFISRSFGLKHYGTIYGVIAMAGALSTAVALVLFGQMHDATGSYDLALVIGAVLFGLGAVAFGAMWRRSPTAITAESATAPSRHPPSPPGEGVAKLCFATGGEGGGELAEFGAAAPPVASRCACRDTLPLRGGRANPPPYPLPFPAPPSAPSAGCVGGAALGSDSRGRRSVGRGRGWLALRG
jgi:predicted MFS family arabinose efflux permease